MKPGVRNMVLTGKVGEDSNGYPCIRFSKEDVGLFEKGREYAVMIMGIIDHKRTVRDSMRIVMENY